MGISTEWLADLNPQQREEFKKSLLSNKKVLDKLIEMLYNRVTKTEEVSEVDYDSPGWAFKQAHLNGQSEAYRQIIKLLQL